MDTQPVPLKGHRLLHLQESKNMHVQIHIAGDPEDNKILFEAFGESTKNAFSFGLFGEYTIYYRTKRAANKAIHSAYWQIKKDGVLVMFLTTHAGLEGIRYGKSHAIIQPFDYGRQ
jgi:hypothetical protein